MILCPNCKHQELTGALFCSECGAQLREYTPWSTHAFEKDQTETDDANRNSVSSMSQGSLSTGEVIGLLILAANKMVQLGGHSEYTIGRVSENQPIVPDINLTDFDAYVQGVSRLHASLKVGRQRISIRDLGSANGTRVNGQKIVPNVDYPLKHGDKVALGKMEIQIVISTP